MCSTKDSSWSKMTPKSRTEVEKTKVGNSKDKAYGDTFLIIKVCISYYKSLRNLNSTIYTIIVVETKSRRNDRRRNDRKPYGLKIRAYLLAMNEMICNLQTNRFPMM